MARKRRKARKKTQTIDLSPNRETVLTVDTHQRLRLELPEGVRVSKRKSTTKE